MCTGRLASRRRSEAAKAEFADQSGRISRYRYTTRRGPRFSMKIAADDYYYYYYSVVVSRDDGEDAAAAHLVPTVTNRDRSECSRVHVPPGDDQQEGTDLRGENQLTKGNEIVVRTIGPGTRSGNNSHGIEVVPSRLC